MPEAITPSASSSPLGQPAGADPVLIERQRIANIHSLCASHGLGSAFAAQLVDRGLPVAAARDAILDALADRDQASGNHFGSPSATFDNPGFFGQAMEDALYAKLSGKAATGPAAEFRGMSMVDMAAEMITRAGRGNPRRMTPDQILNAAAWLGGGPRAWGGGSGNYATSRSAIVTTAGDFPDLLQASGQRFLLDQYKAAESPLKRIGRPRQARDFRPINTLQLSQFGTLPVVAEGGEIVTGTFASRKETYQLQTFAKQFSLTRQAIINDDLGAFSDPLTIMGRAAAETEAQLLAALINSNPAMADGQALFSSTHANLNDTGAAPAVPALDAARQAMRLQKDADGTTYINAAPHYIVSGVAYETAIERLISIPTNPTQVDQANPFFGKLVPLVDPRLGGNYWYLFSDPSFVPTIEYANLNGAEGPTAEMQNGWDVLGCSFRVYEDFGAGIVDYRGAYRQAGA